MADRYCAWIRIGGRLERARLNEFLAVFHGIRLKLEWGDALFEPRDASELLDAKEGKWLWLCDEEATCGEFAELEDVCRSLGLSYGRHSEAYCSYDAELVDWRPGMREPLWQLARNDGETTLVSQEKVKRALDALETGHTQRALRMLHKLCPQIKVLPPFEIV